jgi:hypothetical protein
LLFVGNLCNFSDSIRYKDINSAYNKEDAKAEAKQEYWDIDEIIQVTPM